MTGIVSQILPSKVNHVTKVNFWKELDELSHLLYLLTDCQGACKSLVRPL